MPTAWIDVDEERFTLDDISKGLYSAGADSFKKSALDFCRDWLNGKGKFQLTTSGSTGTPKKIEVTREQLQASAIATARALGLQRGNTSLVCLDVRYIAGVMMMVRSLEVGMNMILTVPASNPLEKLGKDTFIDFTALVPLQLETILRSPQREKLNQIRIALIGGAALHNSTIKEIEKMTCRFYATYGMTETLSHIALQPLNGESAQSFYQALPGITLQQDHRGCLLIKAPYLGEQPIITNDIVELITPSEFRWLGRADTIINTGGVKVIPEKIEASVGMVWDELSLPNRYFIGASADELLGETVTLFIEGSPFTHQTEDIILTKLKTMLDRFECPKSIRYTAKFSYTDTGKINKPKTLATLSTT